MDIYYVYAYLRASNNSPYYIGKGKGKRAYHKSHNVSVPKDKSKIVFLEQNLSEEEAIQLEIKYISQYGRKNNHTGILRNLTDGGEGVSGLVVTEYSIQARKTNIRIHGEKVWAAASKANTIRQKELYSNGTNSISIGNKNHATCPHCRKEGQRNAMLRWHFSNCKQNQPISAQIVPFDI